MSPFELAPARAAPKPMQPPPGLHLATAHWLGGFHSTAGGGNHLPLDHSVPDAHRAVVGGNSSRRTTQRATDIQMLRGGAA